MNANYLKSKRTFGLEKNLGSTSYLFVSCFGCLWYSFIFLETFARFLKKNRTFLLWAKKKENSILGLTSTKSLFVF